MKYSTEVKLKKKSEHRNSLEVAGEEMNSNREGKIHGNWDCSFLAHRKSSFPFLRDTSISFPQLQGKTSLWSHLGGLKEILSFFSSNPRL